jgi:hypothetical protein
MIIKMMTFERDSEGKIKLYKVPNQVWSFPKINWIQIQEKSKVIFDEVDEKSKYKGRLLLTDDYYHIYIDCCFVCGERYLSKEVKELIKQGNVDINLMEYDLG